MNASFGAAIVAIAISQLGHSDHDPGCPPVGCYGGRGKNWCSEFVSWAYRGAGVPFSGGKSADPWLLNDTGKLIRWFKSNGTWVDRQSPKWKTFEPKPGDYVFIGRARKRGRGLTSRAHSGIVESIDSDGTLHTIEGNNHRRPVMRLEYPNFRMNSQVNGTANGIIRGFGRLKSDQK